MEVEEGGVVSDECARVWDEIWQRQPLLFLSFRERSRNHSHLRLRRSRAAAVSI